jgi:hypothetical protein
MAPETVGWIGGIGGGLLGTLGGAVGTYFGVKNTAGPRERAFMVKAAAAGWIAVAMFLGALMLTPQPYSFLLWLPYLVVLPS